MSTARFSFTDIRAESTPVSAKFMSLWYRSDVNPPVFSALGRELVIACLFCKFLSPCLSLCVYVFVCGCVYVLHRKESTWRLYWSACEWDLALFLWGLYCVRVCVYVYYCMRFVVCVSWQPLPTAAERESGMYISRLPRCNHGSLLPSIFSCRLPLPVPYQFSSSSASPGTSSKPIPYISSIWCILGGTRVYNHWKLMMLWMRSDCSSSLNVPFGFIMLFWLLFLFALRLCHPRAQSLGVGKNTGILSPLMYSWTGFPFHFSKFRHGCSFKNSYRFFSCPDWRNLF